MENIAHRQFAFHAHMQTVTVVVDNQQKSNQVLSREIQQFKRSQLRLQITVTRVGPVGWRALLGREARAVGRFRGDPPSCASPRRHHGHAGAADPPAADPPAGAGDVAGMRRPRRVRLLRRERSGDPHVAGHLRVPRDMPAVALRRAAAQVTHLLRQAAAA